MATKEDTPKVEVSVGIDEDQAPVKKGGATSKVNPYAAVVADANTDGKVRRVAGLTNEAHVKATVAQVRRAATAIERTALIELFPASSGFGFRFQIVAKISRKPKGGTAAPAADAVPAS